MEEWAKRPASTVSGSGVKSPNCGLRLNTSRGFSTSRRRSGKRQAAPFAKGPPKAEPKKPGRKPGKDYGAKAHRPPPEHIDETYEAPLPDACPDCGGPVDETGIDHQYQVEIPRRPVQRQFNIHIGCCRRCRRRLQGRHSLQTSDALGAAAAQLGPDAQAAVVDFNKQAGMSHGKISRVFQTLFGIRLSRGGSTHVVLRAARRSEPVYTAICQAVKESPWAVLDETGWHVGGVNAWLHGLVGADATAYVIDPTRSGVVGERLLGLDYPGVMIHDGWSPYDAFAKARHQQCLGHLLRRCHELLETATRGAVPLPPPRPRTTSDGFGPSGSARRRWTEPPWPVRLPRPAAQPVGRRDLSAQNQPGQRTPGSAPVEPSR